MVLVFPEKEFVNFRGKTVKGYHIDGYMKANIDFLQKAVQHNWDGIILIIGAEGTGKSTFAQSLAHYVDPTLNIDRVCFSPEQLMKAIDTSGKGKAIIWDEAVLGAASQDAANQMQQILIKKFTLIRSRNLFIFIIIPNLWMLRRYFATVRTRCAIHCYSPDGITRGFFRFFSAKRKKKLYIYGYKEWDMNCVTPNFKGRFANFANMFVPTNLYEEKKQEAVRQLTENTKKTDKEMLKEVFNDYKLKLKIDIEKWKGKQKDMMQAKLAELKTKYDSKYKKFQEDYKGDKKDWAEKLKKLEWEKKHVVKSKANQLAEQKEKDFNELLYIFYKEYKEVYKKAHPDIIYRQDEFLAMLICNYVRIKERTELSKLLEKGKAINETLK